MAQEQEERWEEEMWEEGEWYYEDSDDEEARAEAEAEAQARKEEEARHQARIEAMAEAALPKVRQNGLVLKGLSPELQNHRDVVLAAVKNNGEALRHAGAECRADREIVLEAVKSCGEALGYANLKYREDREVVLAAVCNDGAALKYGYVRDDQICVEALKSNPDYAWYMLPLRKLSADVLLEAVKTQSRSWERASEELLVDRAFMLKAFKVTSVDSQTFLYADEKFQQDRSFVLEVVQENPALLPHIPQQFLRDREVVAEATNKEGISFCHASPELRSDKDLLLLALRNCQTDWEIGQCKKKADKSLLEEEVWKEVREASWSSIAVQGQHAPILSVTVTQVCDEGSDQQLMDIASSFLCEVTLMSGTSFSCRIPDSSHPDAISGNERDGPTLDDLAIAVLEELPKFAQAVDYTFFIISSADEDPTPVTVWEWRRPLKDFVQPSNPTC